MRAKDNAVLADHLGFADPAKKYTSPDIQNELIGLCANQIVTSLVQDCNAARYFGFIADEATDCSTKEQASICIRFFDQTTKIVREEFLGFVEAQSTTGEALAELFTDELESKGIDLEKMRAQAYDGAANMAGIHRGVQSRIKERIPGASYVHCKAHNLNLSIVHASEEPLARNMMDTVQAIAFAFDYSAKRLLSFKENLQQNEPVKEEMEKRQKLKTLCETRWASRSEALYTFLTSYNVVVDSLEDLERKGDAKARSFVCSIKKFDFIITLVAVQSVLQPLVPLSDMLQQKGVDLIEAISESRIIIEQLNRKRNNDESWDELFEKARKLADTIEEAPSIPRGATRQRHRVNVPAENPSQYWKRAMYLPFLDHLIQELTNRLVTNEDRFCVQYLIPKKLSGLTRELTEKLYETFSDDLIAKDVSEFRQEIDRWVLKWDIASDPKPSNLSETLQATSYDLYPNIYICLVILITMPVTTATAERSFSVMRRIKTYVRATMLTERLSSLSVLHAYKHWDLDTEKIIDSFALKKKRRLAFLFSTQTEDQE